MAKQSNPQFSHLITDANVLRPIVAMAMAAAVLIAPQAHAENVHLGSDVPSAEQIIKALSAPVIKTRSARPVKPNSVSLEVFFAFDSAELTGGAVRQLTPVGQALQSQELERIHFTLEGHTDATGDETYNYSLSERRANSVKQFFKEEFGIAESRLVSVGKGETDLLDALTPDSAKNRRVKIIAN